MINLKIQRIEEIFLDKSPYNLRIITHEIQKYIVHVAATARGITNINILNDLDHKLFTIFINESCDISVKEKMILILHHVDVKECVW